MKATLWLCTVVTTMLCTTTQSICASPLAHYQYTLTPRSLYKDNLYTELKRTKPSLSIVNPLDVLRQRLLLEIARRQMRENSKQVEINRMILKNVGKRASPAGDIKDYEGVPAAAMAELEGIHNNYQLPQLQPQLFAWPPKLPVAMRVSSRAGYHHPLAYPKYDDDVYHPMDLRDLNQIDATNVDPRIMGRREEDQEADAQTVSQHSSSGAGRRSEMEDDVAAAAAEYEDLQQQQRQETGLNI